MMRSKEFIYGLLLLLLPLLSTSCLDDGGNQVTLAAQPAVVQLESEDAKVLLLKGGDLIYAEKLNTDPNIEVGDCGLVDFVLDYSDAQNIQSRDSLGYYTASDLTFYPLTRIPLHPVLADTSTVVWTERVITNIYPKTVLLENNLFLFTDHAIRFNIKGVNFSYNKENGPFVDENGKRIYDIYMRIIGDSTGTQKEIKYNVLALDSLLHYQAPVEQAAGMDSLNFRINYLSAIKNDSTPAWRISQNYTVVLPEK